MSLILNVTKIAIFAAAVGLATLGALLSAALLGLFMRTEGSVTTSIVFPFNSLAANVAWALPTCFVLVATAGALCTYFDVAGTASRSWYVASGLGGLVAGMAITGAMRLLFWYGNFSDLQSIAVAKQTNLAVVSPVPIWLALLLKLAPPLVGAETACGAYNWLNRTSQHEDENP